MWHLLADYIGIQSRSVVEIVGVVRGIRRGQRTWMNRMGRCTMRIGLRPLLGHRRSMNHRAIHESSCCEDGSAPEEKQTLAGFIQEMEPRPNLKALLIDSSGCITWSKLPNPATAGCERGF